MRTFLHFLALLLTSAASHSATMVTAANLPHPNTKSGFSTGAGIGIDGGTFDNRLAQSFLATQTGTLQDVTFAGSYLSSDAPTVPLRIDVTTFSGGQPGSILATAYVPVSQFPTSMPFPAQLSVTALFSGSTLQLLAGTTYALVFRTDTVDANYRLSGGYQDTLFGVPGYSSGYASKSQNSTTFQPMSSTADLYFQVRVNTVPEPSSAAILACGCVVIAASGRRISAGRRAKRV